MRDPILRLAMRTTRRTRATAWGIAFACMVLVGGLSLADGLSTGVRGVASRFESGPAAYIQGDDLLMSRVDPGSLTGASFDFHALRVHPGRLEVNGLDLEVFVASLEIHANGNVTSYFPPGPRDLAPDVGLRGFIEEESGRPVEMDAHLTLFDTRITNLTVIGPPVVLPRILPSGWLWIRPEFMAEIDEEEGASIQAILPVDSPDPAAASALGLTRLHPVGAIGFVRGSVDLAVDALTSLVVVIAVVIGLLVYSAMSVEVHQRIDEIRTLRGLGASPRAIATIYQGQALVLAALGATLGSSLGILLAHGIVSFAPLLGLPNLVVLSPPIQGVSLAYLASFVAAALGGIVPSRRAALVPPHPKEVG